MNSTLVGRKLGAYEVTELLGQGGMATVYKGYQKSVGRSVAIKVLPPHPGLDEQFIKRFQLEAQTVGGLQHPHILPLYDYGQEDDILYLVMAYIESGALENIIQEGSLSLQQIEMLLIQVASALDFAHRNGVVHRDIKPANILVDSEGHALLADFGIVKMAEGGGNLTGTGVVGTPAYMAPEQGQGLKIDGRADIYALGVVVYEMLTGDPPYSATTPMQVLLKHIRDPIPDILTVKPDLPPGLQYVMQKVLAKEPGERYQSAVEFAEDFTRAIHNTEDSIVEVQLEMPLETAPVTHAPPTEDKPTTVIVQQPGGLNNPIVLLGALGLIAVIVVVVAALLLNQDYQPAAVPLTDVVASNEIPTQPGQSVAAAVTATDEPAEIAALPTDTPAPNFGRLTFTNLEGWGDTANLQLSNLRSPADGTTYVAWLRNPVDGTTLKLGTLSLDGFGGAWLVFTDPEGRLLPTVFSELLITEEENAGDEQPQGEIRYSGSLPQEASTALTAIFIESDAGINGSGLLESAQTEAGFAASHAEFAAQASNIGGTKTHGEHVINILEGTSEDYNGNGRGENPGRGFGVDVFLRAVESYLDEAASAPTASISLQIDADLTMVCVQNVRNWTNRVVELEREIMASDDAEVAEAWSDEALEILGALLDGVDANGDGRIDSFENECGLAQIPTFGVVLGSMDILEGPPQ